MSETNTIPEGMPTPKTYKEWAVAVLCGLDFGEPVGEPKTPIEKYLAYAVEKKKDMGSLHEDIVDNP